jgi:hypothetical protein
MFAIGWGHLQEGEQRWVGLASVAPHVAQVLTLLHFRQQSYCQGEMELKGELQAVLWIRIRKNPKVLAGSESEKKLGFGSRHCCRMKICVKNRRSNTWKRKILWFSIENFFPLTYRFQNTFWKQLEAPFRKLWGQNIILRIRIRVRIRKKWVRIHNTGCKSMKQLPV